ncbi:MAG TPA: WbqC family protein [archaeon]|nr:WbqC family protein [archaeon]
MIATIHQVNYLPWLGFFSKIKSSDAFVMFDVADYSKNGLMNRNKIRTADGWMYLTVPIEKKFHRRPFNEVLLPPNEKWREEHWKAMLFNYKKADYFGSYGDFFEKLYKKKHKTLMELNEEIILYIFKQLGINVKIFKTTELGTDKRLKKTDILLDILKSISADTYLSGAGGKTYIEPEKFREAGIGLRFQEYEHPEYRQRFDGFVPFMAVIDVLFNMGEKTKDLI